MKLAAGVAIDRTDWTYRSGNRPEMLKLLPKRDRAIRVLKIGCGEGAFSASIPGATETWGIEPDRRSAEIAASRLTKVFTATYDEIERELPSAYFDLVVCNDVIEHMTDHDVFLRSIRACMAPGSCLLGSVPNVRCFSNLFNLIIARDWHYQDSGILDRTHYRFFTFRSLRRALEDASFTVTKLQGLNPPGKFDWHPRAVAEQLFRYLMILLSAGRASDINYMQIGFLAASNRRQPMPPG